MSSTLPQRQAITPEGHARLVAELERLVTTERSRVAAELRQAREDGLDPGENVGLASALAAQAELERRIAELETTLADVRIAAPPVDGVAGLGQAVLLRFDGRLEPVLYTLVGAPEADPGERRVSIDSPIGRAVAGHRAGETVSVAAPSGMRRVRILSVKRA